MSEVSNFDEQVCFSDLTVRISESLTDIQWNILNRQLIYGESLETIGGGLGIANARVHHMQSKAFEKLIKLLHKEIEYFSTKLESLLADANGSITIKDCLISFPSISEAEFIILFEICQKNRCTMFQREKGLISIREKL